ADNTERRAFPVNGVDEGTRGAPVAEPIWNGPRRWLIPISHCASPSFTSVPLGGGPSGGGPWCVSCSKHSHCPSTSKPLATATIPKTAKRFGRSRDLPKLGPSSRLQKS